MGAFAHVRCMAPNRYKIQVRGMVQGVGFRPFVHALAVRHGLGGVIRNSTAGAEIEVEGQASEIEAFLGELVREGPPHATIAEVERSPTAPLGATEFRIEPSTSSARGPVLLPADRATCEECLREALLRSTRRFGHPFIACTRCGPRMTIVLGAPFDRERTTMAIFPLCKACASEYRDPADRRFHAQAIACPDCGPTLRLETRSGEAVHAPDPIRYVAARIASGEIAAVKGLGGFHLVCDATSNATVEELRRRKQRDAKPFAVMVKDIEHARELGHFTEAAARTLVSSARPIVIVPSLPESPLAPAVAPAGRNVGLLLPYTALHALLIDRLDRPLVLTSGNVSDEPIACTDTEAHELLAGIADVFLTNDRPIALRCEDSVVRATRRSAIPLRRSRGYSPLPIALPFASERVVLAVGGHLKAVFALASEGRAVLGPHFGDLDGYRAVTAWTEALTFFERLFGVRPDVVVHDLHPDYASTRYALDRAARDGIRAVAVQHHHAHLASCMADNELTGEVIGVCFDGTGLGDDGTLWGGEFLVGGYGGYRRAAHFRAVPLVGGDRAAREPWRVGVAYLALAGIDPHDTGFFEEIDRGVLDNVLHLARRKRGPMTSSVGRLFDAAAAFIGVCNLARYEGETGQRLEALARDCDDEGSYPVLLDAGVIDTVPMIAAMVEDRRRGASAEVMARRFHTGVVDAVVATCTALREATGLDRVCLSGGVFANALLSDEVPVRLEAARFRVYSHRQVPPNDGGICLGQAAVGVWSGGSPMS